MEIAGNLIENLVNAEKNLRTADHMIYITLPLINDNRLLLKIIQEIKRAIVSCINSILYYEASQKRINLYKDPNLNFRTFIEKCTFLYKITKEEINLVLELFDFVDKHKKSSFEFMRKDKIVILSEDTKPIVLTLNKTKEFLALGKNILKKTREGVFRKI